MTQENLKTLIAWMDNHVDDDYSKKEMVERIKILIDLLERFEAEKGNRAIGHGSHNNTITTKDVIS